MRVTYITIDAPNAVPLRRAGPQGSYSRACASRTCGFQRQRVRPMWCGQRCAEREQDAGQQIAVYRNWAGRRTDSVVSKHSPWLVATIEFCGNATWRVPSQTTIIRQGRKGRGREQPDRFRLRSGADDSAIEERCNGQAEVGNKKRGRASPQRFEGLLDRIPRSHRSADHVTELHEATGCPRIDAAGRRDKDIDDDDDAIRRTQATLRSTAGGCHSGPRERAQFFLHARTREARPPDSSPAEGTFSAPMLTR